MLGVRAAYKPIPESPLPLRGLARHIDSLDLSRRANSRSTELSIWWNDFDARSHSPNCCRVSLQTQDISLQAISRPFVGNVRAEVLLHFLFLVEHLRGPAIDSIEKCRQCAHAIGEHF